MNRRDIRHPSLLVMVFISFNFIFCVGKSHADPSTFTKSFTALDAFGQNPASSHDAFIRSEGFGPHATYWQPTTPNVWGEVVYRFDVPFAISTANLDAHIESYNGHDLPNFDSGGTAYLDVSTDALAWHTIVSVEPAVLSDSYLNHFDISALVYDSNVVFLRARLLTTVDNGSFSATQFMRINGDGGGYDPVTLRATAVPEPSSLLLVSICAILAKPMMTAGKPRR